MLNFLINRDALEKHNITLPKWLIRIGDASYSTYLSHVLVLSVLGYVWKVVGNDDIISHILMLAFMVSTCLIYGWLSYQYLEKKFIKFSLNIYNGKSIKF